MKINLQFDFIPDKVKNTLTIRREFAAERDLVWQCYTKSELLNQWFAPKPFTTKTKTMDFREGGHWHYAMVDPDGKEYWGRMDYVKIKPVEFYNGLDCFCDEEGTVNTELPRASWDVSFLNKGEHAIVETVVTYHSLADLETIIQMGMQEGMSSTLEKLDELLAEIKKNK